MKEIVKRKFSKKLLLKEVLKKSLMMILIIISDLDEIPNPKIN